jgi:membrane-associated protease RseP (regulator of RpoE activity)
MIICYLLFLFALLPTIIMHELAHFLACKIVNCGVDFINIGFGKPLFSFYYKNIRYNFTPILLGGYVKLEGEMEINNSPTAFINLKYYKKFIIAMAGCLTNLLLGGSLMYLGKIISNYIIYYIGFFNVLAGIGNLLPIPGLDGSYPILVWLEKIIKKEKAISILNKIIKVSIRIILFLNIIILPWFFIKGIPILNLIIEIYWKGF